MIHLIGNAHLDPAWMWTLEEGLEAFAATCRSALDTIAEYPDLIFTCSSAAHFEYIEQTDPELFGRIQDAVRTGRWCIVGGWWVEADCNLPSGESLIRQSLLGQRYFQSRFGKIANVGYNIDSFGHNANMPALLSGAGLTSYIFMRPEQHELELPAASFSWQAPSGDSVNAYRLPLHYSNHQHDVSEKLNLLPEYPLYRSGVEWMIFFGVGNHGGGPTIEQLEQIRVVARSRKDIVLSDSEQFFSHVAPNMSFTGEMNPHAIGAYSANAEIKMLNRQAERALDRAERMQVMRSRLIKGFEKESLERAWKDLCLTQFHDLLGGVSIREASDECIRLQHSAIAAAERSSRLDRQRIASQIETAAIQNLVIFNDRAYERTEYIEFELWHPHASEHGDILDAVTLVAEDGERTPCQKIQPSGKIGEDRVRWLARVSTPSFGWNTFEVVEHETTLASTGVGDSQIDVRLVVCRDEGDTWAHGLTSYHPSHATFAETSRHVIEEGPLRTGVRKHFTYCKSRAEIESFRYLDEDFIEVRVLLDWHEPDEAVLLAIPHGVANPIVRYEIPYSYIDRPADRMEYPGQTWLDVFDTASGIGMAVVNDGKYSFSSDSEYLYVTLARSKPYAYHAPPHVRHEDERTRYLDHGVQQCRFVIQQHDAALTPSTLQRLSERVNERLAVHHESMHAGALGKEYSMLSSEPENVHIVAFKQAEEDEEVVVRLVELNGLRTAVALDGEIVGAEFELSPFAIETIKGKRASRVDFLERPL